MIGANRARVRSDTKIQESLTEALRHRGKFDFRECFAKAMSHVVKIISPFASGTPEEKGPGDEEAFTVPESGGRASAIHIHDFCR